MAGRLSGKRAIVTAAGQGIGRAIAEAFAREQAVVFGSDADAEKLSELKEKGIQTARLDVTDVRAVREYVAAVGRVDVLVNCAGWVHHGTILEAGEADWDRSFETNLRSMFRTIRAVLPGMIERGGGTILNIASVVSSIKAAPNRCVYAATKAGVIGLTKAVAIDFVRDGIRCNAICPGTIDTPSLGERIRAFPDPRSARERFIARQPMQRFGKVEEVAHLAVYLASDESAFVTGAAYVIDGGMSL
ncbi:MAG TPA: SDR family oxidoreductase [Alphaproteobacteria bacterium]|nr:SDR family oxidoreductase [Alphaproteobacteria bacterium]